MTTTFRFLVLWFIFFPCGIISAQDTLKFETITSIKDIPHATARQKWMWPHRSIVYFFMKERIPKNDTSYYSRIKGTLVVTIPLSTRFANFQLGDGRTSNLLQFQPNSQYDLGISINSRFASFLVNTGLTVFGGDPKIKGKTTYTDYQFNFYGSKSTTDLTLQTYKGFYIQNSNSFENFRNNRPYKYELRPDVSVFSFGYNYYRILNHNKFSYRGSFAFTELQKKSAGSLLLGGYVSLFALAADSSLVSETFTQYFDTSAYVKSAAVFNIGLNIGYVYTFVIRKKIFATLSLVQGLGADKTITTLYDDTQENNDYRFSSKQNLRVALRYDSGKLFFGTMGMFDSYLFDDKDRATFNYASGKVRVFVGYRFPIAAQERKLLQKLNLIDYRL